MREGTAEASVVVTQKSGAGQTLPTARAGVGDSVQVSLSRGGGGGRSEVSRNILISIISLIVYIFLLYSHNVSLLI